MVSPSRKTLVPYAYDSKRGWDGYSLMVGLIFHLGGTEIRERGRGGQKFMRGGTGIHERGDKILEGGDRHS